MSLKVIIGNDIVRYTTYDFLLLLLFRSNYIPIFILASLPVQGSARYWSKSQNFAPICA